MSAENDQSAMDSLDESSTMFKFNSRMNSNNNNAYSRNINNITSSKIGTLD